MAGKIDAASTRRSPTPRVAPDDDENRRRRHPTLGALVDLLEERLGQASLGVRATTALPGPPVELTDGRPATRVADDHEDPRLAVLGARCERRRLEDPFDDVVGQVIGSEGPAGAVAQDDVEEVGHGCGS